MPSSGYKTHASVAVKSKYGQLLSRTVEVSNNVSFLTKPLNI